MQAQAQIDRALNEGGEGHSQASVNRDEADRAAYIAAAAANRTAFAAEWTAEVFAARRAAWNAEMLALSAKRVTMTPKLMSAIVARLGYGLDDIKRAKALLGA